MTDSAVTQAMIEERPEKDTIRDLWATRVGEIRAGLPGGEEEPPLYLSLCGARGLDIVKLAERGVIGRTETGAIAEGDLGQLYAIESDRAAALALQEEFNGLEVLDRKLEDILKMPSDLAWPEKKMRKILRSRVVNLDLNCSLAAKLRQNQLHFPVVKMVEKFSRLHAEDPHIDWTLCLTLHADLNFAPGAFDRIATFLGENFSREAAYAEASVALLGQDLYDLLVAGHCEDSSASDLEPAQVQSLLMALIPKRIISDTHRHGWKVSTRRNIRYGSGEEIAPMVTWMLDFVWDPRGSSAPATLYSESLRGAIAGNEEVNEDGQLVELAA
jgi:hypothetical protein